MPYITDEERERAIQYFLKNIPEGTLMRIYEEVHKDPDWLILHHFSLGMDIRNLLRVGGFTWPDTVLDHEWEPITFEAARWAYRERGKQHR